MSAGLDDASVAFPMQEAAADPPIGTTAAVRQVVSLWRQQFWRLTLGMVLSVASLIAGVALLALAGGTTVTGPHVPLWVAGALLAASGGLRALGIVRVVLRYVERLATHDAMFRALADLRTWFFRRLAARSAGGTAYRHSADLLSRLVSDIEALDAIYLRINVPMVGALLLLPILVVVVSLRDLPLALVIAALYAASAFVLPSVAARMTDRAGERLVRRQAALRVSVVDAVGGIREVRAFNAEGRMLAAAQGREARLIAAQLELGRRATLADTLAFLIGQAALLALLAAVAAGFGTVLPAVPASPAVAPAAGHAVSGLAALGARLSSAHPQAALSFVVVTVFLVIGIFETVAGLPRAGVLLGHAGAAARRVVEAAGGSDEAASGRKPARSVPAAAASRPSPSAVGRSNSARAGAADAGDAARPDTVRFENVRFGWSAARDVLDGASFEIPAGSRVAILGPSGAGKSTIASLMLGIAAPDSGRITLGGVDVAAMDPASLRRRIGLLGQATHLFADTIRANLLLARPDATEPDLWSALDTAAIGDWVRAQPDGLDTWLGEGGALVSGGQGRRIALARAWLSEAPILILDEPAAGLDAETERAFFATLNAAAAGRTIVLIAHRLTGVERVDRLYRLAGGRLAAAAA